MAGAGLRKGGRRNYEKLTVSLPSDLAEMTREAMRARGLPTFGAYVAEVIPRDLGFRRFEELLDAKFAEQPMTDDERAWAERALYR